MGKVKEKVEAYAIGKKRKFIVDAHGKPIEVILGINEYRKMLEELEDLEDIRAYDKAKAEKDEIIPFRQAIKEIEAKRK